MKILHILVFTFPIFWILSMSSCREITEALPTNPPASTITTVIQENTPSVVIATLTPSATPPPPSQTQTLSPTPDICSSSHWQKNSINILSTVKFGSFGPGTSKIYDQILISHNPAWEDYRQKYQDKEWTAGVIISQYAFHPHGKGVSPAVILVTYGVEHDWELPDYGALIAKVEQIRIFLNEYERQWILEEVDRTKYPPIKNGASYALYKYFEGDNNLLEEWCRTYIEVYEESPLAD